MINILQINIGECRAAHDLLRATAALRGADLLFISEPNRILGFSLDGWFFDSSGRAAIAIMGNFPIDEIGPPETGFIWVATKGLRMYSCYCSPNASDADFGGFTRKLEDSIRSAGCDVIVAGDFNSKSPEWGSPKEDKRGKWLADLAASLGLIVCNDGRKPTFVRGSSESHIDLTFISQSSAGRVSGWEVLEEESLSLHRYISFSVDATSNRPSACDRKGWSITKLLRPKLAEAIECGMPAAATAGKDDCKRMTDWLTDICDRCMPKHNYSGRRRPVPWWNSDIAGQRKKCLLARRAYTRKRRIRDEPGCAVEKASFKQERKVLAGMILAAKEDNWRRICEMVEEDPWGLPYKIVMKKLNRRKPIPGINLPGRLESIVSALFPSSSVCDNLETIVQSEAFNIPEFSPEEVAAVARGLPNGKAPGPDGIPNEVLKAAVKAYPGRFALMYNGCLRKAFYPLEWKAANLVLLRKSGRALENPSAYRPLCMLDTIGKLFEKLLIGRLRTHTTASGQVTKNQYGFRAGKSTVDAMARIRCIYQTANGRANKLFVGMLTLDVKNAFNSAPWAGIRHALAKIGTPLYLQRIISSYLSERSINVRKADGSTATFKVSCGVPQGSVLGPDLWNILYDELLRIRLPTDVEFIAFADDIAILATAPVPFLLEERLEDALGSVVSWMDANNLQLDMEKTEAIVLTNRNVRNTMTVNFRGHSFQSKKNIKYLGVQVDARLHFGEHAILSSKRAADAGRQLAMILPNLRGSKQNTRRLLACVVSSRLLYGAPFWYPSITGKAMTKMSAVLARTTLRVACCYQTVSHAAAAVISGIPPLPLLAEERTMVYTGTERRENFSSLNGKDNGRRA